MSPLHNCIPKSIPVLFYVSINLIIIFTTCISAYPMGNNLKDLQKSMSPLASKVIYESPPVQLDKVYQDFFVTSKPLNLRKYGPNRRMKKPKKDSKIYFIPIPAMPYRFIPGVGIDYQPMKINPIMMEMTVKPQIQEPVVPVTAATYPQPQTSYNGLAHTYLPPHMKLTTSSPIKTRTTKKPIPDNMEESKIVRVKSPFSAYFFNGRPFKLKVAHANLKNSNLTPENLESNFYYKNNIIY